MKMRLKKYKEKLPKPLTPATLCFLITEKEILLGMKKRSLGVGKWNGIGGKQEEGEKLEDTAIRETWEEIGVKPLSVSKKAILKFYHPHKSDWNQEVHVFFCEVWKGEPQESEEMAPKWFKKHKLPYEQMWEDDLHWFPKLLSGKTVEADFLYGKDGKIKEFEIEEKTF